MVVVKPNFFSFMVMKVITGKQGNEDDKPVRPSRQHNKKRRMLKASRRFYFFATNLNQAAESVHACQIQIELRAHHVVQGRFRVFAGKLETIEVIARNITRDVVTVKTRCFKTSQRWIDIRNR